MDLCHVNIRLPPVFLTTTFSLLVVLSILSYLDTVRLCTTIMLPTYNSNFRRQKYRSLSQPTAVDSLRDRLLSRSRATNLAVVIFGCILGISLIANFRHAFLLSHSAYTQRFDSVPELMADTVTYNHSIFDLDHLIIVAGHAIWKGGDPEDFKFDTEWVLDVAQKGRGNPEAFHAHIAKG